MCVRKRKLKNIKIYNKKMDLVCKIFESFVCTTFFRWRFSEGIATLCLSLTFTDSPDRNLDFLDQNPDFPDQYSFKEY